MHFGSSSFCAQMDSSLVGTGCWGGGGKQEMESLAGSLIISLFLITLNI